MVPFVTPANTIVKRSLLFRRHSSCQEGQRCLERYGGEAKPKRRALRDEEAPGSNARQQHNNGCDF